MVMHTQIKLLKSVKSLIHNFVDRFEFAVQPDYSALRKQLDSIWVQIRQTLISYPSTFPPEILPRILTKYAHAEPMMEEANQAENPVLWLVEQLQPLCDYLDSIAYSKISHDLSTANLAR